MRSWLHGVRALSRPERSARHVPAAVMALCQPTASNSAGWTRPRTRARRAWLRSPRAAAHGEVNNQGESWSRQQP